MLQPPLLPYAPDTNLEITATKNFWFSKYPSLNSIINTYESGALRRRNLVVPLLRLSCAPDTKLEISARK